MKRIFSILPLSIRQFFISIYVVASLYPAQATDSLKIDSLKIDSLKIDPLKIDPLKIDPLKIDSLKIDSLKIDSLKIDSLKIDSLKIDSLKTDPLKIDSLKIDSLKIDSLKIDSLKIDSLKIDSLKIDPLKIDSHMIDSLAIDLTASLKGQMTNPAFLALKRGKHIISDDWFAPHLTLHLGYGSDRLALTPYSAFWNTENTQQQIDLISTIIQKSFNLEGLSVDEVSKKIGKKLEHGLSLFSSAGYTLIDVLRRRIRVGITTSMATEVKLPGAPFLILFSGALQPGVTLDMTSFEARSEVATYITLAYGRPFSSFPWIQTIYDLTHDYLGFSRSSAGAALRIVLGHALFDLTSPEGAIHLSDDGAMINIQEKFRITSAGTGLKGPFIFDPDLSGFPLAGFGLGLDLGYLASGEHASAGLCLRNIGFTRWFETQNAEYCLQQDSMDIRSLLKTIDKAYFYIRDSLSLQPARPFYTPLATALTLDIHYTLTPFAHRKKQWRLLSDEMTGSLIYDQGIFSHPATSGRPQLSVAITNNFLYSYLPVRFGLKFGGQERLSSNIAFSLNTPVIHLMVGYAAYGSAVLYPKRGMNLNFSFYAAIRPIKYLLFRERTLYSQDRLKLPPPPKPDSIAVPTKDSLSKPKIDTIHADTIHADTIHADTPHADTPLADTIHTRTMSTDTTDPSLEKMPDKTGQDSTSVPDISIVPTRTDSLSAHRKEKTIGSTATSDTLAQPPQFPIVLPPTDTLVKPTFLRR